ncbi:adenylate kinase [Perkinsela sp. CCAP 1560/4]|nr:adenylate kinase [Perkinsela sp. CCAP 1560/4]KNH08426.1 adenylate kinase [Perkinsela sp. CCAP 1560/4]|eukprot:KNH06956.1 adenylate kinase [Perkinsela sp. CCAP 1560/4]
MSGNSRNLNVIIMGPPGSGKSTLGSAFKGDYVHLSTGDLIRDEIARGTDVGKLLRQDVEKGSLVSGLTVSMLIIQRLLSSNSSGKGFIIDGYPRTVGQVNFLRTSGVRIDMVIVLHCDKDSLVRRITNRRIDARTQKVYSLDDLPEGIQPEMLQTRADDNEQVLTKRYEQYKQTEHEILQAFRFLGKIDSYCLHEYHPAHIVHIDAERPKEAIVAECTKQIAYYREMWPIDTQRGMKVVMSKL